MTPNQLRIACDRAGGVSALARMIGKPRLYIQRRLAPVGRMRTEPEPISTMDELAILKALNLESASQLTSNERKTP